MFYSKYSNYFPDQIITEEYQAVCNEILNLAEGKPVEITEKIKHILYDGGYEDFSINSNITNPDNPFLEQNRRTDFAYILATNPELFDVIEKENAILFHGTNSNALMSILTHGVCSVNELINKGINVSTGEKSTRIIDERTFISFTDQISTAIDYSSLLPEGNEKKESFRNGNWYVIK